MEQQQQQPTSILSSLRMIKFIGARRLLGLSKWPEYSTYDCQRYSFKGTDVLHGERWEKKNELKQQTQGCLDDEDYFRIEEELVKIIFVSHRWLSEDDPDPESIQLQAVQGFLQSFPSKDLDQLVVFYDYSSLKQRPRTQQEDEEFDRDLQSHPSLIQGAYFLAIITTDYFDRFWCFFELLMTNEKDVNAIGEATQNIEELISKFRLSFSKWAWCRDFGTGTNWGFPAENSFYAYGKYWGRLECDSRLPNLTNGVHFLNERMAREFEETDRNALQRLVSDRKVTNGKDFQILLNLIWSVYRKWVLVKEERCVLIISNPENPFLSSRYSSYKRFYGG